MKSLSDYKINEKKGNQMHMTSVNIIREYETCYTFLLYIVHDSRSFFYLKDFIVFIITYIIIKVKNLENVNNYKN